MDTPVKNTFFVDKGNGSNLENGLPYFAAGIVLSKHFDKEPNASGKDYCVRYISPFGEVCCEWRAADEISIIEVDSHDFEHLERVIQEFEN